MRGLAASWLSEGLISSGGIKGGRGTENTEKVGREGSIQEQLLLGLGCA